MALAGIVKSPVSVIVWTSFVPAVGTLLVWLPLAVLRFGGGHSVSGAFLLAWGVLVIAMSAVNSRTGGAGADFWVSQVAAVVMGDRRARVADSDVLRAAPVPGEHVIVAVQGNRLVVSPRGG